eukprot:tig00021217_g19335.t1
MSSQAFRRAFGQSVRAVEEAIPKRMGGGHGHGADANPPLYSGKPLNKAKTGFWIGLGVVAGFGVPAIAAVYQLKKGG